ncbi:MAG: agmatinase [Pseudomonadota bacterium]
MTISLHGFPWDAGSSYARGPALAPAVIRAVLFSDASSPYSLSGVNIEDAIGCYDFESLPKNGAEARAAIERRIVKSLNENKKPISLGGDHSVTYPILRAMKAHYGPLNILQIDAHTDLYEEFEGDRYSHACPFARAIEDGCINQLVQIGLRSVTPQAKNFGETNGVVMLGADETGAIPFEWLQSPLYVTIDLDGLDPAFAPGVSHPEPGGLSTRDVLSILKSLSVSPVGADVVELNPERDVNLTTANVAARLVKELIGLMAGRP